MGAVSEGSGTVQENPTLGIPVANLTYNPHIIPLPSYYNPNKGWTPHGVHKLEFWDCRWTPQGLHVEADFVTWDFFKVRNKMQHEE